MADPILAFIDFMRAEGIGPEDAAQIVADDKPHRYRLSGDKMKTLNGSYCLKVEADGFAVGWARSFKDGETRKWHTKSPRKSTPEERAAHKARAEAAKRAREAEEARLASLAAQKAQRAWKAALRDGTTPYLERKGCGLHGCRIAGDALLVPMWREGKLVGLQRISPDGSKRFGAGTAKAGAYHAIKGGDVLVIAEGFATAAAVHEATGHSLVVAFDAGNLKPVAQAMRAKYPERRIVIAADNDQWTTRQDGTPWNPGVEKAQQAAAAVGGAPVVIPSVPHDHPDRPTDWDDVARIWGADAVRSAFSEALNPREPEPEMGETWEPVYDLDPVVGDEDNLRYIRPLGYDDGTYYFLPRLTGQVTPLTAGALASVQTLQRLAPRVFWETMFSGDGGDKKMCAFASAALMDACHRVGIYNPDRVRGIGAWMEGSDCVFNTGSRIVTPDASCPVASFKSPSGFLYPLSVDVIGDLPEPMEDAEAWEIVRLCTALRWDNPLAGYYLSGWIVTSILGGVMRWRPHIYITGDRGAGKSTVVDELVKRLLGPLAIEADGGSTEAGIRHAIINSSRPVVMDEAEGNTKADRDKIAAVMNLLRASSSGGTVRNANDEFRCRASFLLAGINPQIKTEADRSRIAVIHLRADDREGAPGRFSEWRRRVSALTRAGVSGRLISRLVLCSRHMPVTLSEIALAIRGMGASARFADQHASLLAGVWLLVKSRAPEAGEAEDFLRKVGLTLQQSEEKDEAAGESWKVLSEIMTSDHSYDANGMARRATIAAMIQMACETMEDTVSARAAAAGLSDLGIEVEDGFVRIASTSPKLSKLLRDTPWSGDGWARHLISLPGARDGKRRAFRGLSRRRTVEVPLDLALGRNDPDDVELPLEDWA